MRLKYLYTGPKTGRRGRPQKFSGNVDLKSPDGSVFIATRLEEVTLYSAVVWAVSLRREVRVVIADFIDPEKKTQARNIRVLVITKNDTISAEIAPIRH